MSFLVHRVSKLGLKDARVLGETPGQRQLEAAVEQSTSAIERFQQIAKGLRSIHSDARRCEVLTEAQNPKVCNARALTLAGPL